MTAIHHHQPRHTALGRNDLIQMIRDGMISRLKRFIVEPYDDGENWCIQTVAIAVPAGSRGDHFPVVIVNFHDTDHDAMSFALCVFRSLKGAGCASVEDVAQWRRSLFTLVPADII